MRGFAVGFALACLLLTGPGWRPPAVAAFGGGPLDGSRQMMVCAVTGAVTFASVRSASPPSPEQDGRTFAVLGEHPQLPAHSTDIVTGPAGSWRRLLVQLCHPQRGPPFPLV